MSVVERVCTTERVVMPKDKQQSSNDIKPKKLSSKVSSKPAIAQPEAEIVQPKADKALEDTAVAKAGKRSAKVKAEVLKEEVKQAKKVEAKKVIEAPKSIQKPRVIRYTKNQKVARELISKDKLYPLKEAIELLPQISSVKFDATAELHITLNIDPRQADQIVRTNSILPAGTGKVLKVAVVAAEPEAEAAKASGADMYDAEAIISQITQEKFNFDVLIATPEKMGELGKLAKVLGPKGLMPSPKNGTVTTDPASAVEEFKKGKIEIKNDANGVVHISIGKLSFKSEDLFTNAKSAIKSLSSAKPSGVKGVFIRNMFLSSSMSPSIKLDRSEAVKTAKQ